MKYRTEVITPERARKLLDQTAQLGFNNRSIRQARVEKLSHAISLGQWQLTHQPLAITTDGAVLDGQHRLQAIVMADKEVEMLVVRDAAPETFSVVDTGAARTTGDALKISGFTDVNHLSAAVRGFIAYDQIVGTTDQFKKMSALITSTDVLEFLDDPDRRQVAQRAISEASRTANGLARYGLKSAIAMSMMLVQLRKNEVGSSTAVEFYARLEDGVSLAADSPILALRKWFMHDTGYNLVAGELRRPLACANIVKCMNDYALGRPRSVMHFKVGREVWPAPLPVGSRLRLEQQLERQEKDWDEAHSPAN